MNNTYELSMSSQCPVDPRVTDSYKFTITADRMIKVEDIHDAIKQLPEPAFQEELTQALADKLSANVTSVGFHSGVKTTCVANTKPA